MPNERSFARGSSSVWIAVLLAVFGHVTSAPANVTQRDDKLIFTVIQFANTLCGTGIESGTCYTSTQCERFGGTTFGTCARGAGTCCGVSLTGCGGDIRINNTWVYSINYPNTYNDDLVCTYRVYFDDTPGKICNIRYDFAAHDLVAPNVDGVCDRDRMVFREDTKSTYFCGMAPKDYHWYVETAGTVSPHTFTILTDTSNYYRRYAMRVSFIRCKENVPSKCGQYFLGTSGTINSYNYNNGYYLAGLKYGICFRRETGYCTYTLKKTSNNQYIDDSDMLRLPVGSKIQLIANPSFVPFGANNFCKVASVKAAAMYYTPTLCYYPDSITTAQQQGPFFVNFYTPIDTTDNVNPLVRSPPQSGFEFDWNANECNKI